MNRKMILVFCILSLSVFVQAQQTVNNPVIKITGTRFTYPLLQKWIDEYGKIVPSVKIIIEARIPADSADILIASHVLRQGDVKEGYNSVTLNRYILLPVVNSSRSDLAALQKKGITTEALRTIFFSAEKESPITNNEWIVYKREKPSCSSIAFANYFGNEQKDILGIPVPGDDRDLLSVIKREPSAISYNSSAVIYDIKTRKVADSVAIVPIDLNNNGIIDGKEKIYSTLDDLLGYTEKNNDPAIPVDRVHAIYKKDSEKYVRDFLDWIIEKGNLYNHQYGFLQLPEGINPFGEKKQTVLTQHSCTTPGRKALQQKNKEIK